MPERTFYLIVRGAGSWGGGNPFRTYRAGVHEVSAEVAEAVLAFKEKHPNASWLILSDVQPEVEDGSLVGLLLPEGLQPGMTSSSPTRSRPASAPNSQPSANSAPPSGCAQDAAEQAAPHQIDSQVGRAQPTEAASPPSTAGPVRQLSPDWLHAWHQAE